MQATELQGLANSLDEKIKEIEELNQSIDDLNEKIEIEDSIRNKMLDEYYEIVKENGFEVHSPKDNNSYACCVTAISKVFPIDNVIIRVYFSSFNTEEDYKNAESEVKDGKYSMMYTSYVVLALQKYKKNTCVEEIVLGKINYYELCYKHCIVGTQGEYLNNSIKKYKSSNMIKIPKEFFTLEDGGKGDIVFDMSHYVPFGGEEDLTCYGRSVRFYYKTDGVTVTLSDKEF